MRIAYSPSTHPGEMLLEESLKPLEITPAPGLPGRYRLVFTNGRERLSVRVIVTP